MDDTLREITLLVHVYPTIKYLIIIFINFQLFTGNCYCIFCFNIYLILILCVLVLKILFQLISIANIKKVKRDWWYYIYIYI